MATGTSEGVQQSERELLITRDFDAPRALVFKPWTDPRHMSQWLGPTDFRCTSCDLDVQTDGAFRACICSPEGKEHWMQGVYREIVPPERLVFTFAWEDAAGAPVHETLVTLTFEEQAGRTRQTFHQALFRTEIERDDHRGGWSESFECLAAYLKNL